MIKLAQLLNSVCVRVCVSRTLRLASKRHTHKLSQPLLFERRFCCVHAAQVVLKMFIHLSVAYTCKNTCYIYIYMYVRLHVVFHKFVFIYIYIANILYVFYLVCMCSVSVISAIYWSVHVQCQVCEPKRSEPWARPAGFAAFCRWVVHNRHISSVWPVSLWNGLPGSWIFSTRRQYLISTVLDIAL